VGFFVRRAVRLGPIRLNLSKSGVGASVGVRGLRVGEDARGRRYVFARIIPGWLYYRDSLGSGGPLRGVSWPALLGLLLILAGAFAAVVFVAMH
jgi:hypothetical protein